MNVPLTRPYMGKMYKMARPHGEPHTSTRIAAVSSLFTFYKVQLNEDPCMTARDGAG